MYFVHTHHGFLLWFLEFPMYSEEEEENAPIQHTATQGGITETWCSSLISM